MNLGESLTIGGATITKTRNAQMAGAYRATEVDAAKAGADFLLTDVGGSLNGIRWSDGRRDRVTDRQLIKLQAAHKWATDF